MEYTFRDKPYYDSKGISSLDALASTLDIPKKALVDLSNNASRHYHSFEFTSNNGKVRQLNDPKFHLKKIQKRINSRIFSHIEFPQYLHGGIKDKDYFTNASSHSKAEFIYCFDIKGFYDNITREHVVKIFKYLCKFTPEVSEVLASLTTLDDKVPQGGVTSSNIANLVFFENEYRIVKRLRRKGISYTRLLDDIVISSDKKISVEEKTKIAKTVSSLVTKYGFDLNNRKTKFVSRNHPNELMKVTGLWVNQASPRCIKSERKRIRAAVYVCEKQYGQDVDEKTRKEYHELWNRTSGRVAMLSRLHHPQATVLRQRLEQIMPTLSEEVRKNLHKQVFELERLSVKRLDNIKYIKRVNKIFNTLGVLGRTHKKEADSLRKRLSEIASLKSYKRFWEE